MVIIDEECRKVKIYRKVLENSDRKCYTIRLRIVKTPTSNNVNPKNTNDACIRKEKPSCLPSSLAIPPSDPPLSPLRKPMHICCTSQPISSEARKRNNKVRTRRVEKDCQTVGACAKKIERDTQCSLILPPKRTQDNQCQTAHKELKHCGHQISPFCEKSTRHCQTELERSCCGEGIAHDRKTCTKSCCNKNNCVKRDASCQAVCGAIISNDAKMKATNNRQQKGKCRNRPAAACRKEHDFPFVGRTSSGNLKVCPNMVSYEHKEFGILVAKPNSIRTTVRRLTSCEMRVEEESPCPPPPVVPPTPAFRGPNRYQHEPSNSSSRRDSSCCRTPSSILPPPPLTRLSNNENIIPHRQHYHHHRHRSHPSFKRDQDNLEPVQTPFSMERDGLQREYSTEQEHTFVSRNEMGHTDGWNYINPEVQQEEHRHRAYHDNKHHEKIFHPSHEVWNRGQEVSSESTVSPKSWERDENGPEEGRAPYTPAFPVEKMRQPQLQETRKLWKSDFV